MVSSPFPSMETIRTFATKEDYDIFSNVMQAHQKKSCDKEIRRSKRICCTTTREPKDSLLSFTSARYYRQKV